MAESVELATILLTDLVGSTRLATSVGPVRADELREEHFELLRDAIASSNGREVKNTGDGLMVAFASASAAVECAVAMQQLFERRYRGADQTMHVRIGLAAGESTVRDGDYFGMPSIEAARLCAEASTDGILVSAGVKMFAGRCEGIEFESAGQLELKGFPNPVEAFSVSWVPLSEEAQEAGELGRWPLPSLLRSVPPMAYVGRVEERATLERAMAHARSGQRHVVLLSGEPGIGKTRLSSYLAHRAHAEGFAVCWGGCSEELAVPYEPWIEICEQLVENAPEELLAEHLKQHGGELGRLARNLRLRVDWLPEPQSSDPETERYLLFNSVVGVLGDAAQAVPLCVVLDDLHWADAQSLVLLKHVLRATGQRALQLIATYRDSDLGKDHPLTSVLADLRSSQDVQRIALQGLDADEVSQFMSVVAGHELDADALGLAREIAGETDGNPLFVGEMLRSLVESGRLLYDEETARWSVDRPGPLELPESVREVIARRVARLGDETREVLTLGAVVGRSFEVELLLRMVAVTEGELLDRLEAAVAASLLEEAADGSGRFRFVHALVNQTLYESLGQTRRARMHRRVAEALEDLYGADSEERVGELALHWRLAGTAGDPRKAGLYASRAGRRALVSLAPAEAVTLFSDALKLLGPVEDDERCRALIGLGRAQQLAGDAAYRETLLDASRIASALEDCELAAGSALANTRGFTSAIGELDEPRVDAIERALQLDDRSDPGRRPQLLALESQELLYEHDRTRRHTLAKEAIALAGEIGNPRVRARVLQHAFHGLWSPDMAAMRSGLAEDLLASAKATEDRAEEFWAYYLLMQVSLETCAFTRAQDARDRVQELAAALGQPTLSWVARVAVASWEQVRGNFTTAERLARQALEIGYSAGQPDALQVYGENRALIRVYQGRGGEQLIELSRQAARAHPRMGVWDASTAQYESRFGSTGAATAILENAAENRLEQVGWDLLRLTALAFYADAAARVNSLEVAALTHELLTPWRDQFVWSGVSGYGHVRMWLAITAAMLGRDREADDDFDFSCRFHEENELRLWSARSHLGWAQAYLARGEVAPAQQHAARALEFARGHDYGLIEAQAAPIVNTTVTAT